MHSSNNGRSDGCNHARNGRIQNTPLKNSKDDEGRNDNDDGQDDSQHDVLVEQPLGSNQRAEHPVGDTVFVVGFGLAE